jgi:hypothetical protein
MYARSMPPPNVVTIARVYKQDDQGVIEFDSHNLTAVGSIGAFELDRGAGWDGVELVDWDG